MPRTRSCKVCATPLTRVQKTYCSWYCRGEGRRIDPAQLRANRIAGCERRAQKYRDETRAAAVNHYRPWTDEEIAMAADRSMSARQAALKMGRTIDTVKKMRRITRAILDDDPGDDHPEDDWAAS